MPCGPEETGETGPAAGLPMTFTVVVTCVARNSAGRQKEKRRVRSAPPQQTGHDFPLCNAQLRQEHSTPIGEVKRIRYLEWPFLIVCGATLLYALCDLGVLRIQSTLFGSWITQHADRGWQGRVENGQHAGRMAGTPPEAPATTRSYAQAGWPGRVRHGTTGGRPRSPRTYHGFVLKESQGRSCPDVAREGACYLCAVGRGMPRQPAGRLWPSFPPRLAPTSCAAIPRRSRWRGRP
jgi:hypothetical protein